jgi:N-acetylneuraminic acid mutarotase
VVEAYNPQTNTWSKASSLPLPACGVTAGTTANGTIIAVGGSTVTGGEQGTKITPATGSVMALDPATKRWTTLTRAPYPRKHAGAVVEPDGTIYVIGGADAFGRATATVQRFAARG